MDEEPEAYRIGNIPFLGLTIYLDSRPLIPRPETEWWCEELIHAILRQAPAAFTAEKSSDLPSPSGQTISSQTPREPVRFLDVCAGSGAIGCAVLKECPEAHVSFGEIDPAHEATIWKNIRENQLDEARADVRIGDLFAPYKGLTFDFIVANPPYIPDGRELPASVINYEPALALRAGTDGLSVLRRIAAELPKYLKKGGQAWIECDSPAAIAAGALFHVQGFDVSIRNDQYERPRLLVVSFPYA